MADKYRLLKDLPGVSAGVLVERVPGTDKFKNSVMQMMIGPETIKLTEWFEPIEDRWKPRPGGAYWLIDNKGRTQKEQNDGMAFDKDCISYGNCFRTEDLAALAAGKISELLMQFHKENK